MTKETVLDLLGIELGPVRLKCALLSLKVLKAGLYGIGNIEEDLDGLKTTDVGFISGSGVDFKIKKIVFSLQYRYSMGFVDLALPTGPGAPKIALRNYNHALTLFLCSF